MCPIQLMTPNGSSPLPDVCVCRTDYDLGTTTLSVEVGDDEAARAQEWADRLGIDRSQLLRDALHRHLANLAARGGRRAR
jgi:hypothetical protein